MHRALGVVLARASGTKGRQDIVASVLQHAPSVVLHDGGAARQRVVHDRADGLGVQALAQRGEAHHVEEQNRDLLEDLSRFNGCGQ